MSLERFEKYLKEQTNKWSRTNRRISSAERIRSNLESLNLLSDGDLRRVCMPNSSSLELDSVYTELRKAMEISCGIWVPLTHNPGFSEVYEWITSLQERMIRRTMNESTYNSLVGKPSEVIVTDLFAQLSFAA